jgi:hypothetical protein
VVILTVRNIGKAIAYIYMKKDYKKKKIKKGREREKYRKRKKERKILRHELWVL